MDKKEVQQKILDTIGCCLGGEAYVGVYFDNKEIKSVGKGISHLVDSYLKLEDSAKSEDSAELEDVIEYIKNAVDDQMRKMASLGYIQV